VLGKIKKFAHLVKGWTLLPYEEHSLEKAVAMNKRRYSHPWSITISYPKLARAYAGLPVSSPVSLLPFF